MTDNLRRARYWTTTGVCIVAAWAALNWLARGRM